MNLPIKDLIEGSPNHNEIELIFNYANKAFNTWKPIWTPFVAAPIKEEIIKKLIQLNDIECIANGGYPSSERQRICFKRISQKIDLKNEIAPIAGLSIEGNFLFERAQKIDFHNFLIQQAVAIGEIGDIWLIKDKGAQVICTVETSKKLDQKIGTIRGVEISCESLSINQLSLPFSRSPKKLKSVEASTRLDAIASAGFGLSRAKIVTHIKEGRLRVNWITVKQSNRSLKIGDRIDLEEKGSIEVLNLEPTKRERWRVELLRQ